MNKQKAFTLAEVLITLGVIGVVATITMPTVIKNYQKKVTAEKLKVAYSIFFNALERAKEDNGGKIDFTQEMMQQWSNSVLFLETYVDPYLQGVEPYSGTQKIDLTALDGTKTPGLYRNDYLKGKCLKNGMCYVTFHNGANYLYLLVDLNGPKGPNKTAKDTFCFNINWKENNLKQPLLSGNVYGVSKNSTYEQVKDLCINSTGWTSGTACTELIIRNNWKITKDYPW